MYTKGFTLIELLVVVLIIAVLAAIALPQYQKAVERSRAMEAISAIKAVYDANKIYYMTHGVYADSFAKLDISLPWESDTKWYNYHHDAKGTKDWTMHLQGGGDKDDAAIFIARKTGPYEGAGFIYQLAAKTFVDMPVHELLCTEQSKNPHLFKKEKGAFCEKLMHGTEVVLQKKTGSLRVYRFHS